MVLVRSSLLKMLKSKFLAHTTHAHDSALGSQYNTCMSNVEIEKVCVLSVGRLVTSIGSQASRGNRGFVARYIDR